MQPNLHVCTTYINTGEYSVATTDNELAVDTHKKDATDMLASKKQDVIWVLYYDAIFVNRETNYLGVTLVHTLPHRKHMER